MNRKLFSATFTLLFVLLLPYTSFAYNHFQFPVFFGNDNAKNTIILYNNIECPSCKKLWPEILMLITKLDENKTRLIVLGGGNGEKGHMAMLVARALAKQNKYIAREFITSAFTRKEAITDAFEFAKTLAREKGVSIDTRLFENDLTAANYNKGVVGKNATRDKYGLRYTPVLIINGTVYKGALKSEQILKYFNSTKEYSQLP